MRKIHLIWALALFALLSLGVTPLRAQEEDESGVADVEEFVDEPLYTIFSMKLSGGYGLGRGRQVYGGTGGDATYWSLGEGAKMDVGLVVPLLPVDIMNPDGEEFGEPSRYPVVGLELEAASGYHLSVGGTTTDVLIDGRMMKTVRTYSAVPVTLGFNARAALGPGMPSVFIGAGGGVNLRAIYQDEISFTNSQTETTYVRSYDPPLPFILYGVFGFEIPLLYSPDDGNSMVDFFMQLKLEEGTTYVYDYKMTGSDGSQSVVRPNEDELLLFPVGDARSLSNASLSLGFKINIF